MNLPTRAAAASLGRSPDYLKRLRESHGGFLEHQVHYWLGHSPNAPITWNVEAVCEAIAKRGIQARIKSGRA